MNITEFVQELAKININPTEEQLEALEIYKNILLEYNQKFNLTAIKTDSEIYLKHFYDSLTITKEIDLKSNLKLLDIGTGAGFPGLVLKIFFPNLEITLLDSNNKKISFLETVIKRLNLQDITCLHGRAEELGSKYFEYFDIITSRAVAHLRILAELSLPYLSLNGYFIPLKGNVTNELEESESTIKTLGGKLVNINEFMLPIENSTRTIIKITKIQSTPENYPRPYDKILHHPIK